MNDESAPTTSTPRARGLRGRYKDALIIDLADGESTHAELADKHGISKQGVAEFAVRNRAAITQLKEAAAEELAGMWGAIQRLKLGELEDKYESAEQELDDPNLSAAERLKLRNLLRQFIRDMNEITQTATTRSVVSVESVPRLITEVVGWD
jgi:hypothetical protein